MPWKVCEMQCSALHIIPLSIAAFQYQNASGILEVACQRNQDFQVYHPNAELDPFFSEWPRLFHIAPCPEKVSSYNTHLLPVSRSKRSRQPPAALAAFAAEYYNHANLKID
jgi:hypothetical protein